MLLPSSPLRRHFFRSIVLASLSVAAWRPSPALAQRSEPGFTRQSLLVATLTPAPGTEHGLGRKAADVIRSRVSRLSTRRETEVIDGYTIDGHLLRASLRPDSALAEVDVVVLGRYSRADEYVLGRVEAPLRGPARIDAELVLVRDIHIRQPLPSATGANLDGAADQMAREIVAARSQMMPMRRCENALREGHPRQAVEFARAALTSYPRGAIVGTCLVWALRAAAVPPSELLAAAEGVLAVDSMNPHALQAAANALDSLRRKDDAAIAWLRLARTDTADLELSARVIFALLDNDNAAHAEPFASAVSDAHPDHAQLLAYKWRAALATKNWPHVAEAGEALLRRDSLAVRDSVVYLKLATAYSHVGKPYQAVEIAARGVARFPQDAALYALYAQFVRAEADTVLPRGIAMFPRSADLLALNAQALRARGKLAESLASSRQAMWIDSTMSQGELLVAQTEMELGRPDSALTALRVALARGKDSSLVASFLLAKGNTLYRTASGTKVTGDFQVAVRFLGLADSVRSSSQSRYLLGAAALGAAQAALTEAPQLAPRAQPRGATPDSARSCDLARYGATMLDVARSGLAAGAELGAAGATESLGYVDQLVPYASRELAAYCAPAGGPSGPAVREPGGSP